MNTTLVSLLLCVSVVVCLAYQENQSQDEVLTGGNVRVKRQTIAEKQEIQKKVLEQQRKADYYRYLVDKRKSELKEQKKADEDFHEKRKEQLKLIIQQAKTARDNHVANVARAKAARTAADVPVVSAPAAAAPIITTTPFSIETTKVYMRIPDSLFKRFHSFMNHYNGKTLEMSEQETDELKRKYPAPTTTTTTTTTTAAPTTTTPPQHYIHLEIPESVYHNKWRFFKKYALRANDEAISIPAAAVLDATPEIVTKVDSAESSGADPATEEI